MPDPLQLDFDTILMPSGRTVPLDTVISVYGRKLKELEDARKLSDAYAERAHNALVSVIGELTRAGQRELADKVQRVMEGIDVTPTPD